MFHSKLQEIITYYGPSETVLGEIYDYYTANNRERTAIEYIVELNEKYPGNKAVDGYYKLVKKNSYELYNSFQKIGSYVGAYAVYEYDGKVGIIDEAGEIVLSAAYDSLRIPENFEDGIPVLVDGQCYFVSVEGYKIAQPNEAYQELGILSGNRILAKKDGKYGYLDAGLNVKTEFVWDDATNYYGSIAAVKKGDKWALINRKGEFLSEYIYEDVKRDENYNISFNGLIWVKKENKYQLINEELEVIHESGYEDVKLFLSGEFCAVKRNGMWGFLSSDGQEVIPCVYEEAESFTIGYAAVKKDGLWGYIGTDGTLMIDCVYDEAKCFNNYGTAPVRRDKTWTLLQLGIYR